jgi:ABC-2 type transport system ATP-binding protein
MTVAVAQVSKRFGAKQAVADLSFEAKGGEVFGLLGPNGAGKTTTLRMVLDIVKPDSGTIRLFAQPFSEASKRRIGYLPEERGLYRDQPVDATLLYLATLKGLSEAEARRRLAIWLERLDLAEHRRQKVQALSKGMQQKAQIIATLIHEPELIVIDEPFAGLDPVNTRLVKDILLEQCRAGRVIIMSTHQMHQAEALCERILLIDHGQAMVYGRLREIKHQFAGHAVTVIGEGDFSHIPGVVEASHANGGWHMALARGTDPQSVFCSLAGCPNARIERFELEEPSLDDIFVTIVRGPQSEAHHA